jgi:large subunit ribosomal protein L13
MTNNNTHSVDATDRTLGRVASEVAKLLMGKDSATFERNEVSKNKVNLINVSKAKIDPKKFRAKTYLSYSGYPGGLKERTMERVIEKKGYSEVFRKAVYGMLPINKLRDKMIKNLTISE